MTDKTPETQRPLSDEKLNEPPILRDVVEDIAHRRVREASTGDGRNDVEKAPLLSDEYDLSLVDEERELRRQARRW
ncbi:hypothetical protein K5Q02_09485 [Pseudomonas sp. MM211]|uniref:hypothetical protein n=1 Tax=Pseudomonas sp. MM211 TaxID=2866808 RepID=UPI001CECB79D|nr:hypothetical protein [Pseudomonas sp. MM211]UCJ18570.1 hypothetical protein K5Q02_09485 [Pseudomonas sp. MM211]